jgi:hypothetical protein
MAIHLSPWKSGLREGKGYGMIFEDIMMDCGPARGSI